MKRLRKLRDGWLLVAACAAAIAALTVASGEHSSAAGLKDLADIQELVAEQEHEQNDAIPELRDEKAQLRSVADVDGDAVRPPALPELADEKSQLGSVADVDGDAVRPTVLTQRGEPAAHAAMQQRSPSALRGVQKQTIVLAEVASSDVDGLNGPSPLGMVKVENQQLHKILAFTNSYEKKLEPQLKKVALLQYKAASEQERGRKLEMQLHNAARSVAHHKHNLDQAKRHLGSLQRENLDLSGALHNMTTARQVLEAELVKSIYHRDVAEVALGKAKTALSNSGGTRDAIKKLRRSLRQAAELTVEEDGHSKSEKAATQNALHRLAQLKQDLTSSDRKFAGEVARDDKLNKTSTSFVGLLLAELQAEKRGAVRLQSLSTANQKFAREVAFLKRRVAASDNARTHAHEVAAETQNSLARADAKVKELKGIVPWLQDKVAADERDLKQAASDARSAYEARDVATTTVDEAKRKIVHLEEQYASVVQSLAARTNTPPPLSWEQEIAVKSPPNLGEGGSGTSAEDEVDLERGVTNLKRALH